MPPSHLSSESSFPAAESQLAYSVLTDWGGVHVTEGAHEAYGLEPQVPIIEGGRFSPSLGKFVAPRTDILLTEPQLKTDLFNSSGDVETRIIRGGVYHHEGGFIVSASLPNRSEIAAKFFNNFIENIPPGSSPEDIITLGSNLEPLSHEEYLDQITTSELLRLLNQGLVAAVGSAMIHYEDHQSASNIFDRNARLLSTAAGLSLVAIAKSIATGNSDLAVFALTVDTLFIGTSVLDLRRFKRDAYKRADRRDVRVAERVQLISEEMHRIYLPGFDPVSPRSETQDNS